MYAAPLGDSQPIEVGTIQYNPTSSQAQYSAATVPVGAFGSDDDLVVVGEWNGGKWKYTSLVKASMLKPSATQPTITLQMSSSNQEAIGVTWSVPPVSEDSKLKLKELTLNPIVEIRGPVKAPRPGLNKPVILNKETGKVDEQVPEKSLLQRYWWVLLAGAALLMAGGDK